MMVRILNPNLLPTLIAESVACYVVTALLCLPVARVAQVPLRVKQELIGIASILSEIILSPHHEVIASRCSWRRK